MGYASQCKNIVKLYSTYFKSLDLSWNTAENAKDKLLEKANAFASKVYEEAAKANQGAENTDNDSSSNNDDNIVDADYEEK